MTDRMDEQIFDFITMVGWNWKESDIYRNKRTARKSQKRMYVMRKYLAEKTNGDENNENTMTVIKIDEKWINPHLSSL